MKYLFKKFILSLIFSLITTPIVAAQVKTPNIKIEHIVYDYLFLIFLFFGLTISLLHEFLTKDDENYRFGVGLFILSSMITLITTLLVWVFYQNDIIPEKFYYGIVLFSSVFSSGIVRYLLAKLPAKIGNAILNRLNTKIDEK